MEAGTTFLPDAAGSHLWVILSDPRKDAAKVLIVSVTTLTAETEQTCIIERGEHPWVTRRSCVSYRHAMIVSLDELYAGKDSGKLKVQQPMAPEVLKRIRESAARSDFLKPAALNILKQQSLIP
jgi:hypothetical protein